MTYENEILPTDGMDMKYINNYHKETKFILFQILIYRWGSGCIAEQQGKPRSGRKAPSLTEHLSHTRERITV